MLKLLTLAVLISSTASLWLGEEYWTTIGFSGQLLAGRTVADFARLDPAEDNLFVAFWITRTRYPGEHFESFGYASVRHDGRVCGWFIGFHKEPIEVCGGFRVLSNPPLRGGDRLFEWVSAAKGDDPSIIGYLAHRIGRFTDASGAFTYGDAIPTDQRFVAVQRTPDFVQQAGESYLRTVSLLRLGSGPGEIRRHPVDVPFVHAILPDHHSSDGGRVGSAEIGAGALPHNYDNEYPIGRGVYPADASGENRRVFKKHRRARKVFVARRPHEVKSFSDEADD